MLKIKCISCFISWQSVVNRQKLWRCGLSYYCYQYQWYWSQFGVRMSSQLQFRMIESAWVSAQFILLWTERIGAGNSWADLFCVTRDSLWKIFLARCRTDIRPGINLYSDGEESTFGTETARTEQQWSVISVSRAGSEGSNETGNGKLGTMPSLTQSNGDSL